MWRDLVSSPLGVASVPATGLNDQLYPSCITARSGQLIHWASLDLWYINSFRQGSSRKMVYDDGTKSQGEDCKRCYTTGTCASNTHVQFSRIQRLTCIFPSNLDQELNCGRHQGRLSSLCFTFLRLRNLTRRQWVGHTRDHSSICRGSRPIFWKRKWLPDWNLK